MSGRRTATKKPQSLEERIAALEELVTSLTDPEGALSQPDTAALLGVSVRTIQKFAADGRLTPIYLHNRPSYLRREVRALLEQAIAKAS